MGFIHSAALFAFVTIAAFAHAERVVCDVTLARVGDADLKLDLCPPDSGAPAGLAVWVHGGARRGGLRANVDLLGACEAAGVSVEFKIMHGAALGGAVFTDAANLARIDAFLRAHLPRE